MGEAHERATLTDKPKSDLVDLILRYEAEVERLTRRLETAYDRGGRADSFIEGLEAGEHADHEVYKGQKAEVERLREQIRQDELTHKALSEKHIEAEDLRDENKRMRARLRGLQKTTLRYEAEVRRLRGLQKTTEAQRDHWRKENSASMEAREPLEDRIAELEAALRTRREKKEKS